MYPVVYCVIVLVVLSRICGYMTCSTLLLRAYSLGRSFFGVALCCLLGAPASSAAAFIRQAVACAAAVAAYGGTAYAARAEIRAQRGAAACPQRDLQADERALPVPMPVPMGAERAA